MTSPPIRPPKWPQKFLRFFIREDYLEEIEGDMEEIFYDNVKQFSPGKAKRMYSWEMLKLLRPALLSRFKPFQFFNHPIMFKNYFKVSLRGLMKNPLNSFINLFGLAAAIGFCVFGYAYARWAYSRDQFHKNKSEVFLITSLANRDGSTQEYGFTPRPMGELLKEDFAQIKKVCRVEDRKVVVKYGDHVFNEQVRYTDPDFLEMFTFPLKWGTSSSLADINSIILSERKAIKYFGNENPIGQSILVKFDKDQSKVFKVTGVAAPFTPSRSIDFGFLINYQNLRTTEPAYDFHDWSQFVNATFIQVSKPSDLQSIRKGMEKYTQLQNKAVEQDWVISSFAFESLATLHERTADIRNDISEEGSEDNYKVVIFLGIVCGLMLALACFNYINIAIVSAAKRLKELGVRKSIGATRSTVIIQFLTENIVITFFALALGLLLGWTVIIPWFERLWDFDMAFRITDPNLWIYLPIILLITGIASGSYPAFYISGFSTVNILKGSVKFGSKNFLTKVFLGVQIILACLFISCAFIFTLNIDYLGRRSWGYDPHDVLYAVVPNNQSYEQLNTLLSKDPHVLSISGSSDHLGKSNSTTVLHFPDREYEVDLLGVDANYFSTMSLQLKAGRGFNEQEGSDRHAVVVNETLVKNLGWKKPVGQRFKIDSAEYEVIGIVKEFHSYSFSTKVKPAVFRIAEKEDYRYLTMKVRSDSKIETCQSLQAGWSKLFPEIPFHGGFQEDVWGSYFSEIEIHGHVWRVFAGIAMLLACLGLYGLATLNVAGRSKELSIRKVLGATLKNITRDISHPYLILFGAALLIGAPLSYLCNKLILELFYPYHIPVTWWTVSAASIMLVLVLLITVFTQIWKVSKGSPLNGLKSE
jgi:ABC-type antimicrobial peptide transport system permease subunit